LGATRPACFQFTKLCVNILHVADFARPDCANDDKISGGVNTIGDSVSRESVFVIVDEWGAERSAITQGIRRQFFVGSVLELPLNATVETLNIVPAIERELYFEDQGIVGPGSEESILH
jgi:hypothetical protein